MLAPSSQMDGASSQSCGCTSRASKKAIQRYARLLTDIATASDIQALASSQQELCSTNRVESSAHSCSVCWHRNILSDGPLASMIDAASHGMALVTADATRAASVLQESTACCCIYDISRDMSTLLRPLSSFKPGKLNSDFKEQQLSVSGMITAAGLHMNLLRDTDHGGTISEQPRVTIILQHPS